MLPPQDLELLTGYADGELTALERRLAERLLVESEEARELVRRFLADAEAVRTCLGLPPRWISLNRSSPRYTATGCGLSVVPGPPSRVALPCCRAGAASLPPLRWCS